MASSKEKHFVTLRKEIVTKCSVKKQTRSTVQCKASPKELSKLIVGPPFPYRLCTNVVPSQYTLCIKPYLTTLEFEGCVAVKCEIIQPTRIIMLNAFKLKILKIRWMDGESGNGSRQIPSNFTCDTNTQILKIFFPVPLSNNGVLYINFSGRIGSNGVGLYESRVSEDRHDQRRVILTQFEATEARKCFPCWDEPAFKAKFNISLIVPKHVTALSNMPIKIIIPHRKQTELHIVEFDSTPPMSTYLIAFAIGEFEYLEKKTSTGITLRLYTSPGKCQLGQYALEYAAHILPIFETFLGIEYPLSKLDMLPILDFEAGGMENWGLIIYRETEFLSQGAYLHENVRILVAHEIAHMWFGNLVTMYWWNDLWLKEGLATYMEFLSLECLTCTIVDLKLTTDAWSSFLTDIMFPAFEIDSLPDHHHPIQTPVQDPAEIDEIFDHISYCKSAVVLRMLHKYLGEDFQRGLRLYLSRHKYENTVAQDLWNAFHEVSRKDVTPIMESWLTQDGYPLVKIRRHKSRNMKTFVLSQCRFVNFTKSRNEEPNDQLWIIPITFSHSTNPNHIVEEVLMEKRSIRITLSTLQDGDWFLLNPGATGAYRVKYSDEIFYSLIMKAISSRQVSQVDCLYVLDCEFALSVAGKSSVKRVLGLLEELAKKDEAVVWGQINDIMIQLNVVLSSTKCYRHFKHFARTLYSRIYNKFGWTLNTTSTTEKLKLISINGMLRWGHKVCQDKTLNLYTALGKGEMRISELSPPSLFLVIMRTGMEANLDAFHQMLQDACGSEFPERKELCMEIIASSLNRDLLIAAFKFALNECRSEDTIDIFASVGRNPLGTNLAWIFFKRRRKYLHQSLKNSAFLLHDLIFFISKHFTTEAEADDVANYFKSDSFQELHIAVTHAVKEIRIKVLWLKRSMKDICEYFGTFE